MGKGYRTGFVVILILIISIIGVYVCSQFINRSKNKSGFSVVVDKISSYDYTLDERDSDLMRSKFKELKKVLKNKGQVDFEKYATLLAQMYIIDLYDVDKKVNKYDVPCLEYIYPSEKDKFKKMIKEEFYSQIVDNSDGDRKQELPSIKSIDVESTTPSKIKINGKEYESYDVTLSWEYDKDLGYDKKSTVTVVIDKEKAYVVKHSPIID